MTTADADRWEARYRSGTAAYAARPAPFVQQWLPRLPRGRALGLGGSESLLRSG